MRALAFAALLLVGCRAPFTLPVESLPAYAANEPVLTREGITVSRHDGGTLELLAASGHCFEEAETVSGADGSRVTKLEPRFSRLWGCRSHSVGRVRAVIAGPTVAIVGDERTVTADAEAISGVELRGASERSTSYAPETGFRSGAALGVGIGILALGTIAGASLIGAGLTHESTGFMDLSGLTYAVAGAGVLHAGHLGIPLIVYGARRLRLPASEQPSVHFRPSGIGLEW